MDMDIGTLIVEALDLYGEIIDNRFTYGTKTYINIYLDGWVLSNIAKLFVNRSLFKEVDYDYSSLLEPSPY
jgi:hypothetical protein